MPAIDTALLAIYRAARELGCDEFQDTAFAILRGYIPFDSARWARASASPVGVLFHTAHLVNELPAWGDAYSQIRSLDRAATFAIAHPGTTGNFHCESCYPLREDAEMREYFRRYRHEVALVTAHVDRTTGFLFNISLFGANPNKPFSEAERQLMQSLYPHLMEAWVVNQALQIERTRYSAAGRPWSVAVCTPCGHITLAEPSFFPLLQQEWPGRPLDALPAPLRDALKTDAGGFKGHTCVFGFERKTRLAFVRGRQRTVMDQLSERELTVARHVSAGRTHKEVARLMGIAPATVRNHLQAIHEKVGVHNNVDLVAQIKDSGL
jgi:DNA-binding CsgD family transcriptional regulator